MNFKDYIRMKLIHVEYNGDQQKTTSCLLEEKNKKNEFYFFQLYYKVNIVLFIIIQLK